MMYTDKLSVFDFNTINQINSDCTIEDFDNYIVVDNFLNDIDAAEENLLKFPIDNGEEIYQKFYENDKKESPICKIPGHCQMFPVDFFERYIFEIYKILVECEYLPQRANDNLLSQSFPTLLSKNSMMNGLIYHNDMIINKNANAPAPAMGQYYSMLFFDDSSSDSRTGFSLHDFIYEGKRYSCLDDITLITDQELLSEISDFLNAKHMVGKELEKYSPFLGNSYFDESRFVPAKRNRLVITKGGNWFTHVYSGGEESYRLITTFNEPKQ